MKPVAVDCLFLEDGTVRVQRIRWQASWLPVEQGRQWQDDEGRHVLVMIERQKVREIVLRSSSLSWELKTDQDSAATVV